MMGELADLLKKLGIPMPKQLLAVAEAAATPAPAQIHALKPPLCKLLPWLADSARLSRDREPR